MEVDIRLPKMTGSFEIVLDGKIVSSGIHDGSIPEEIMGYSDEVMGNGAARVAVTADVSMKDYGNGVSASVTLSISCNQDDQTIANVAGTLGQWARAFAQQNFNQADAEFQQLFAAKHPDKAPKVYAGPPAFKP